MQNAADSQTVARRILASEIRHKDSILKGTKLAPTRKMRMKFNKPIQLLAISAASLLAASFLSACATLTVDFVYVTSAKAAGPNNYGEVNVFEINSESGRMRQIVTSPFPSGGRNPVAEAVSPDEADLYVVNRDDNSIVQFVIGTDGKLYPQNTVNTPGIFPLGVSCCGKLPLRARYLSAVADLQSSLALLRLRRRVSHPEHRTSSRPQALPTGKHPGNTRGEHQHQRQLLAPLAVGHSRI